MMTMALMMTTVAVAGASRGENDPGEQLEVAAAVQQGAFVQSRGNGGDELAVNVQLHQVGGNVDQDGGAQGVVQAQTVDDLEAGNLGDEGGHQHAGKEQAHNHLFATEGKALDDKGGDGAQQHVENQADRQDDEGVFESDPEILVAQNGLEVLQGDPVKGGQHQGGGVDHVALGFQGGKDGQQDGGDDDEGHAQADQLLEELRQNGAGRTLVQHLHLSSFKITPWMILFWMT